MPHFCAAYELPDRDFAMTEKVAIEKAESILPKENTLRTGGVSLFMRMLGAKGMKLQFLSDSTQNKQQLFTATTVHAYKPAVCPYVSEEPTTIECVRNL